MPPATEQVDVTLGKQHLRAFVEVPAVSTDGRFLLPMLHSLTESVVEAACRETADAGAPVSCHAGCSHCCKRQMVPITESEAHELAALVRALPPNRQREVRQRFDMAIFQLAAAGLLDPLRERPVWRENEGPPLSMEYLVHGITCPFLDDDRCSIHPQRPLVCREYLVTSPPERCGDPFGPQPTRLTLPIRGYRALALAEGRPGELAWMPLVLALEWAEHQAQPGPERGGQALLREVVQKLPREAV